MLTLKHMLTGPKSEATDQGNGYALTTIINSKIKYANCQGVRM